MQIVLLVCALAVLALAPRPTLAQSFQGMLADLQAGKFEPHVRIAVEQPVAFGLARALIESAAKYCPDVATPSQMQDVELSAHANRNYYTLLKYAQHQPTFDRKEKKDLIEFAKSSALATRYDSAWRANRDAADAFVRELIGSGHCAEPKLEAMVRNLFGLLTFGSIPSRDRVYPPTLTEAQPTRDGFVCVYRSSSGDRVRETQHYYRLSTQMIRFVLGLSHRAQTNYMYWRHQCPSRPDPFMPVAREIAPNKAAATDSAEMAKEMAFAFVEQILPDRQPQLRLTADERAQLSRDIALFEALDVQPDKIDQIAATLRDKRIEQLKASARGRPIIYIPEIGEFRMGAETSLRQELFNATHARAFDASAGRPEAVLIAVTTYLKTRPLVKSRAYANVHGRFPN